MAAFFMLLVSAREAEVVNGPQPQDHPSMRAEPVMEAGAVARQAMVKEGVIAPKPKQWISAKAKPTEFKQGVAAKIRDRWAQKRQHRSPLSQNDGDYSQKTALLLAVLLGTFGAHRFYLGYYGIGVVQLLTGGGCGVWTLIDQIRIVTGQLQPKGTIYSKTL